MDRRRPVHLQRPSKRTAPLRSDGGALRLSKKSKDFSDSLKMPILSHRCAAEKSSLRSLNALPCKAFRAFDPTRGGLPPPRAPPPKLRRILLNRGFLTS